MSRREHDPRGTPDRRLRGTQYVAFGEALLWSPEHEFGTSFTPEVKEAWRTLYATCRKRCCKAEHRVPEREARATRRYLLQGQTSVLSRRQLTRSNRAGETRRTDAGAVHGVGSSLCTRTARKQHHKLIEVPWRACKRRDRCTSFFRTQHQSRRIHRHGARHDGSPQGDHARENHSESGPLWPPPSRPFDIQSRRSDNDSTHRYLLAQCLPRSLRSCSARRLLAVASFASRRFCAVDRSVLELCFFGPRIAIEP